MNPKDFAEWSKMFRGNNLDMRITVIGSGYVGLVAGLCFAEIGHSVTLVDNDHEKIEDLRKGRLPIHEQYLQELLTRHGGAKRIHFTESVAEGLDGAAVVFIAVGTPPREDGAPDLSYVEDVVRAIAQNKHDYLVLVEKSTVPVLTHGWIRRVMALNGADPAGFDVVSNPEFLREGTAVVDFLYPDRIIIGADNERSAAIMKAIYEPLTSGEYHKTATVPRPAHSAMPSPLLVTSAKSAELIKHASNAFLATKISFINAVASICESVGADIGEVCRGMGSDSRIGPRFLNAGIGYGGSCFPKDLSAFRLVAEENGYDFALLQEVSRINEQQRHRFLRKVRSALWNIKSKRLAVLGMSFKGGTDDVRESPALAIIRCLLEEGATIVAYDPAAMERARHELGDSIEYADSSYAACEGCDAVLILSEWSEFGELDLAKLKKTMKYPIMIDGRNMFTLEQMQHAGFQYYSVGRPAVIGSDESTPANGIAAKVTSE